MFDSLELLLGGICSLMGIALGYTLLLSLLAGIRLLTKRKSSDL